MSSIPTLRNESGWLTDAQKKADAFAGTFSDNARLPAEVIDTPFFESPENNWMKFLSLDSVSARSC